MTDKFVDQFLARDGESVEDAKARLAAEKAERERKAERRKEAREANTLEEQEKAVINEK